MPIAAPLSPAKISNGIVEIRSIGNHESEYCRADCLPSSTSSFSAE